MAPSIAPEWANNNFLGAHMPLPAFIVIAIIIILVYCILLSVGCAAIRRRQNRDKKPCDDVELTVIITCPSEEGNRMGDDVVGVPGKARLNKVQSWQEGF